MNAKPSFFSFAELKQPVNQWICYAFLGVFCFWLVLFYLTQKTLIIVENYNLAKTADLR